MEAEQESNRILGVSTAQWRKVDLQAQLQLTRLDAEGADRCCFGIEQSIFAAPHTPNFRLLSVLRRKPNRLRVLYLRSGRVSGDSIS
jgi:hypothetical protein